MVITHILQLICKVCALILLLRVLQAARECPALGALTERAEARQSVIHLCITQIGWVEECLGIAEEPQ